MYEKALQMKPLVEELLDKMRVSTKPEEVAYYARAARDASVAIQWLHNLEANARSWQTYLETEDYADKLEALPWWRWWGSLKSIRAAADKI